MPQKLIWLWLYLACWHATASAQHFLDQPVSVTFQDVPLHQALMQVSEQSGAQLSFNPDLLPEKTVTATYQDEKLSRVLSDLVGQHFRVMERGSYVIIQQQQPRRQKSTVQISGEVVDAVTGQSIPKTSIYEVSGLTTTLSDPDGSYTLTTKTPGPRAIFAISKAHYRDTVITVDKTENKFLKLRLNPLSKPESSPKKERKTGGLLLGYKVKSHLQNVTLREERFFQFSLVPGLSTNGPLSGQVSNRLSINLVGGISHSLQGMEIGGAFNINRNAMGGFQAAGAFNTTAGRVNGLQMAGAFNVSGDTTHGSQIAGGVNVSGSLDGLQVAGGTNVAGNLRGAQLSGGVNVAKKTEGLQMAGGYNHAGDSLLGVQVSGGFNLAGPARGIQIAGGMNINEEMRGAQLASGYNHVQDSLHGAQIAGGANYARVTKGVQLAAAYNHTTDTLKGLQLASVNYTSGLRGVQVGVINIAKKAEKGMMIGLINIARDQILALDADYNDVTDYNLSFKSGMKHFYTILTAGLSSRKSIWSTGAGFGSQFDLGQLFYTGFELTSHTLFPTDQWISYAVFNARFRPMLGIKITRQISIYGGPVVHYLFNRQSKIGDFRPETAIGDTPVFEMEYNDAYHKWWIGYQFGIRF